MPELACNSCTECRRERCSGEYCREYLTAWAENKPIPECPNYVPHFWHGIEGVKA